MGHIFQAALVRFLENYANSLPGIRAVYYDPYNECSNLNKRINGIEFIVRPLTPDNEGKSQLCSPEFLGKGSPGNFKDCELYSFVAWDHVSWPGNDYYVGARVTDDGVKAAATNTMQIMTGVAGYYCRDRNKYCPPEGYKNWNDVVAKTSAFIRAENNISIF